MNKRILSYKNTLDNLFSSINTLPSNPELRAHWARYLCVLVSGLIESSVREIYSEYARDKSSPNVANFVEKELSQFQNAKMEKILDIARAFSLEWERELRDATDGRLKEAIDSIVANRHLIVHGKFVGITIVRVSNYYKDVKSVIELIEAQCA